MNTLDTQYQNVIEDVATRIQESEALSTYLESEEFDDYKFLIETYEPELQELYDQVASVDPLQLEALELAMLAPELEGLYLSKIVGYSVLRGEVNDQFKYRFPQDHFKKVVIAMTENSNFEMIKQRVGLSIQIGFALSSDIWITNLIESVRNRGVKYFLESQKIHKYRNIDQRKIALARYKKQFQSLNYMTADFPTTYAELKVFYYRLTTFLKHRILGGYDNSSLTEEINTFVSNTELIGHDEYLRIVTLLGMYFELNADGSKAFSDAFETMAKHDPSFTEVYMSLLDELHKSETGVNATADKRMSSLIKDSSTDGIKEYYSITDTVHSLGFIHEDAIETVRAYYERHEGMSNENECLRYTVLNYIVSVLDNLSAREYAEYFELNKTIVLYISIFNNQKFNQEVKDTSLRFIKKCLKVFTDKRGRDYQDVKKFVSATFLDLGFMKEKEIKDFFKTKRKKKTA